MPIQNLRVFGKSEKNGVPSIESPSQIINIGNGGIPINIYGKNLAKYIGLGNVNQDGLIELKPDGIRHMFVVKINSDAILYSNRRFALYTYTNEFPENGIKGTPRKFPGNNEIKVEAKFGKYLVLGGEPLNLDNSKNYSISFENHKEFIPYQAEQKFLINTPPGGLAGIKVIANGNYTDKNGQQWICDEINSTERIRRIGRIDSYNHESIDTEYMSSTGELSVGANVIYALKEPIKTPLSEEEKLSIKKLHTNHPETLISNDENADMELTYTVDTKSYVDTKIAEVSTAIVQKGIE